MVDEAGQQGARLLAYPEWAIGLNPCEPIPNALTEAFAQAAERNQLLLVMGSIRFLRRRGQKAHQAAIVLGPDGRLLGHQEKLHFYRKERPWFLPGQGLTPIATPLGRMVVLVGKDSVVPELHEEVRALRPDWLILQANEAVTEVDPPAETRAQLHRIMEELSRELAAPTLLVCPVGPFYGRQYTGGSAAAIGGEITVTGPETEGLVFGELAVEVPTGGAGG